MDILIKIKKILDVEIAVQMDILKLHRDSMDLLDLLVIKGTNAFIEVSIRQYDNYNLFQEIDTLKKLNSKNEKELQSIIDFEVQLIKRLNEDGIAELIYLNYAK